MNKTPFSRGVCGFCREQPDNIETMFQVIRHVNLFSKLDEATQKSLCGSLTYETYKPKQVIFRYRDYGDKYYIILSGRVSVQAPVTPSSETFQQIAILEAGSGFGEMALMENKPRAATVVCLEPTGTLGELTCPAKSPLKNQRTASARHSQAECLLTSVRCLRAVSKPSLLTIVSELCLCDTFPAFGESRLLSLEVFPDFALPGEKKRLNTLMAQTLRGRPRLSITCGATVLTREAYQAMAMRKHKEMFEKQ